MSAVQQTPVVGVVGTGGSIAMVGRDRLDLYEYGEFASILDFEQLVEQVPEIAGVARVVGKNFLQIISRGMGPSQWLELVRVIHALVEEKPEISGIVLTHGTATLEETAYFLNLTLKVEIPVVLVGAQRPLSGLGTDGPLNLLNAVRVAVSPQCRGLGVLVVMNGEIHAAREVAKNATHSLEAFQSPNTGMLGYADLDGSVKVYGKPARKHAPYTDFDVTGVRELPRVDIVYSYGGADGVAIRALVEHGARGIVSAGFAPGNTGPDEWDALVEARRQGVLVVQASRSAGGRVLSVNSFQEHDIVAADTLNAQKARILAMLALTVTTDATRIQSFFDEY